MKMRARIGQAAAVLALMCGCASGPLQRGAMIELGDDQGILVLHTDSTVPIQQLRTSPPLGNKKLPAGEQLQLFVVPAGEYRWHDLKLHYTFRGSEFDHRWPTNTNPRWRFRVEPGTLSYGGTILIQVGPFLATGIRPLNRSAMMLPALERDFPDLLDRYGMVYTGHVRDDFLEHYSETRREQGRPPPHPVVEEDAQ